MIDNFKLKLVLIAALAIYYSTLCHTFTSSLNPSRLATKWCMLRHSISFRDPNLSLLMSSAPADVAPVPPKHFIRNIIEDDIRTNKNGARVVTRFPPEPNGYLHLGHAKSICLNFGLSKQYNGVTHMRFDDTNPAKEEMEYVNSILADVKWLVTGSVDPQQPPWYGKVRHASDYFQTLYEGAIYLIKNDMAYIDHLTAGAYL